MIGPSEQCVCLSVVDAKQGSVDTQGILKKLRSPRLDSLNTGLEEGSLPACLPAYLLLA